MFGSSFFFIQSCSNNVVLSPCILAVNQNGLNFLNKETHVGVVSCWAGPLLPPWCTLVSQPGESRTDGSLFGGPPPLVLRWPTCAILRWALRKFFHFLPPGTHCDVLPEGDPVHPHPAPISWIQLPVCGDHVGGSDVPKDHTAAAGAGTRGKGVVCVQV